MNRDPRFARMQSKDPSYDSKPAAQQQQQSIPAEPISSEDSEKEKEKRILEMDLSIFGELELPAFKETDVAEEDEEEDRMGLPFKPHRVQPVAKEIDASIYSHPVLEYKLQPLALNKPDYSGLVASIPASRVQQDPRLKRYSKKRPLPLEPEVAEVEVKASPTSTTVAERPSDPRRKAAPTSTPPQHQQQQKAVEPPKSNVYNPKTDLYASKPRPEDFDYPQKGPQADVYSPSEDVQEMYGSYNRGRPNNHRDGNFDPREEFGGPNPGNNRPNYYDNNDWNERPGPQYEGNRNWGPQQGGPNNWGGPPNHQPGPDQGYYEGPPGGAGYYDGDNNARGDFYNFSQGGHRGMMMRGGGPNRGMPGGPPRNGDPRAQRRDPRRRD
jgi:hypothetical protein